MRRILLTLALLAACDAPKPPAPPSTPSVCATGFLLADVARQVGGEGVKTDWVLDLGDNLDDVAFSPAERARVGNVDLTLCDGERSETWLRGELGSLLGSDRLLALENLPMSATRPPGGLLWLDPIVVRSFVPVLAEKLTLREPRRGAQYADGARAFVAALDAVVARHPNAGFGRGRVLIPSARPAALLDRFGVAYKIVDADPLDLTPTAADELTAVAAREKARVLLLAFDTPPAAVADIETRTRLKVFLLDPIGYPNYAGHDDYLSVLEYNLSQLRAASAY
ncbi:MAG TPA: zinc ABC transporter substrate-binding protein [Tepidisphaeraceae bacterium]